jgi:hypothetical protein
MIFIMAVKSAMTHVFGSAKASMNLDRHLNISKSHIWSLVTYWSRFQCLFSSPAWLDFIRWTARTRSCGSRNLAVVGESGKKNLTGSFNDMSFSNSSPCVPEQDWGNKGQYSRNDHQPVFCVREKNTGSQMTHHCHGMKSEVVVCRMPKLKKPKKIMATPLKATWLGCCQVNCTISDFVGNTHTNIQFVSFVLRGCKTWM